LLPVGAVPVRLELNATGAVALNLTAKYALPIPD
jgi:hypothetical protein